MADLSVGILTAVRELVAVDNEFFRIAVMLPEPTRTTALAARSRRNQDILSLMRRLIAPPQTFQPRFVVSIPVQTEEYEDVIVAPTQPQITAACEYGVTIEDTTCAVCQESVSTGTRLRNCSHSFHTSCILSWFGMSARCPVCRDDVRVRRSEDHPEPTPSGGVSR